MESLQRLEVSSPAFENEGMIPVKYTCDGEDINPPLEIKNMPREAKSMVLIVEDPDAPNGVWTHWMVWNIEPKERIDEDSVPGVQSENDFTEGTYTGPCPPSGAHKYFFKVYALDVRLGDESRLTRGDLESAVQGHAVATGSLMGVYRKVDTG